MTLALTRLVAAGDRRGGAGVRLGSAARGSGSPAQPAARASVLALLRRPGGDRAGAREPHRGVRGVPVQRPHGAAHAPGAGRGAAAAGGRADHAGAARVDATGPAPPAGDPPEPGDARARLPGPRLAGLRGRQLGMAFQYALRPGAGEPAAPLPAARELPGCGAPLLVADPRRRPW